MQGICLFLPQSITCKLVSTVCPLPIYTALTNWRVFEMWNGGEKDITLVNGYFEMYRSFNGAVSRSKFYKQATNEDTIDDIIQYAEYGKMFM